MKILKVKSLNINSLKGAVEIDFESFLKDESLFAITGSTGSGKSTILDIITCALYGKTARLSNPNELMSRHTGEALCEVEFEIKGKIYQSSWSQKRARRKADGKFQSPKMEISECSSGKILESKLKEVPKYIERLSGLDFERFNQSMMLAQGSFDAFLKANEKDRSTLLEKITGTYIYKQVSQEIYETYSEQKQAIESDEKVLGSIELLEKEVVEEKIDMLALSSQKKKGFDKQEDKLKKIALWLENIDKLQNDTLMYEKEFEEILKTKEAKKEDFLALELANKALNIQPLYSEKKTLAQNIKEDKLTLENLQKEQQELKKLLESKIEKSQETKKEFEKESEIFESNNQKLKKVRIFHTEVKAKIKTLQEVEEKVAKQQSDKTEVKEKLDEVLTQQNSIKKEYNVVEEYLTIHKKDSVLKEELPLIAKNLSEYKTVITDLKNVSTNLEKSIKEEKFLKENYSVLKKELEALNNTYDLKESAYKVLDSKTSNHQKEEEKIRDRVKVIDVLITTVIEYQKVLEKILEEDELIKVTDKEVEILTTSITEKNSLIDEVEMHLKTLEEKKEAQALIAKYESDRAKLNRGEACFLCGSEEHPYVDHAKVIDIDETTLKIEQKKKILEMRNQQLKSLEYSFTKFESKLETAEEEKKKLLDSKTLLEHLFKEHKFIQEEDSTLNLAEEKDSLEKRLNAIVSEREEKELLLTQKDNLQKELTKQQSFLTEKEQKLFKLSTNKQHLEKNKKEYSSKKEVLIDELTKSYGQYALVFDEEYDKNFSVLERKKENFLKNETLKKEYEDKLQDITVKLKEYETKLQSLNDSIKEGGDEVSKLNQDIKALEVKRKNILDVENLEEFENEITTAFNMLQEQHNGLLREVATLTEKDKLWAEQSKERIKKQYEDTKKLEVLMQKFEEDLKENDFISFEVFERAILSQERRDTLFKDCKAIDEKYREIETLKNDTVSKLKEQQALKLTKRALDEVEDELKELQPTIDRLQEEIGSIKKELEINSKNAQKHEDKIKELEKKKEAYKIWVKLNEMIGSAKGDKFAKFAQGITLDQLIYLANRHLDILSSRYELQRSLESNKLLEIEVIDSFQGDVSRPVSTLSGGESFIVSLALALGLSALASQKISIDSLFLDEGFGTLDSDSLEMALNALGQLQNSGKMVGVISHVEALKERIPLQIKVLSKGDGTSILEMN